MSRNTLREQIDLSITGIAGHLFSDSIGKFYLLVLALEFNLGQHDTVEYPIINIIYHVAPACETKCRVLSRTWPSHMVRNISSASEYGMAYSYSVRVEPSRRLFSVMLALASEMRTLALWPLLLAIRPSRIRILRMMEYFQLLLAIKNFRSISNGMGYVAPS